MCVCVCGYMCQRQNDTPLLMCEDQSPAQMPDPAWLPPPNPGEHLLCVHITTALQDKNLPCSDPEAEDRYTLHFLIFQEEDDVLPKTTPAVIKSI